MFIGVHTFSVIMCSMMVKLQTLVAFADNLCECFCSSMFSCHGGHPTVFLATTYMLFLRGKLLHYEIRMI